ncbi:PIN-like domain-containing protein [Streptomyces sp. XY006]|uniref:PIN-like domain-containing protein n=1 Tax=Streptomyces sp. XY006 TaxID=2021410 RepID=UPI00118142FB|nr:PIN-like domain-containing protein [Streptomyces sp. XY006]
MRDHFNEYYTPDDEEYRKFLTEGTIVLDTNVLLAPYKLDADTRRQVFSVLESVQGRLWVPYQAGWEFFENRPGVIAGEDKIYQELEKPIKDAKAKLESHFSTLRAHPVVTPEEQTAVMRHVEDALAIVHRLSGGRDGKLEDALRADAVLEQWQRLLAGRLGDPPSHETLSARIELAKDRYAKKTPPGYLDAEKEINTYGDALLWLDVLDKVEKSPGHFLLITNDTKEDWYRRQSGRTIGPRVELVREVASVGGNYYQQKLDAFLKRAARVVDKNVSDKSLEAISRTSEKELQSHLMGRIIHEVRNISPEATLSQPFSLNGPTVDIIVSTRQGSIGIEVKNYAGKLTARDIKYLEDVLATQAMDGFILVSTSEISPVAIKGLKEAANRRGVAFTAATINDFDSIDTFSHAFLATLDRLDSHDSFNKKFRF